MMWTQTMLNRIMRTLANWTLTKRIIPANRGRRPWVACALMLASALTCASEPAGNGGGQSVNGVGRQHAAATPVGIGRIFFSPAERRRRRAGEPSDLAPTPESESALARSRVASDDRLIVNGSITSSARGRAVWINGRAVDDSATRKTAWTDRNGNVWVVGDHGTHLMMPGQSIDHSGEIKDLLPAGAIVRH